RAERGQYQAGREITHCVSYGHASRLWPNDAGCVREMYPVYPCPIREVLHTGSKKLPQKNLAAALELDPAAIFWCEMGSVTPSPRGSPETRTGSTAAACASGISEISAKIALAQTVVQAD